MNPAVDLGLIVAIPLEQNNGFTYTLASRLGQMLTEAQDQFGERDKNYTILGVEFARSNPQIWFPGNCSNIVVQFSLECLNEPRRALYQLAHEVVHLLSPTGAQQASCLEEGLATMFSTAYMMRHFSHPWTPSMVSYQRASAAAGMLLARRPNAIKELRQAEPVISKITSAALLSACPEIDPSLTEYLIRPFLRD